MAPEWFNVCPEWKQKKFREDLIKQQDTVAVFSRYNNWITVTPKHMDRRHPLEKEKMRDEKGTSRIMPYWMTYKSIKGQKDPEIFKSKEYYPIRQKVKKYF
ncbi:MAG: hypothetical protein MJ252_21105 [archaeon]|nr:hypothetical protein [archaeon]